MKFYSDIAENYNYIFPYNKRQKQFTLSFLGERALECSVLDIGCATGNLTFELSKNVKEITGLDFDEEMILYSGNSFSKSVNNLKFICDDMLNIDNYFPENSLDCVMSYGNTIVHLQSEEEFERLFFKIRTSLKPLGNFLFQIINYDRILENGIRGLPTIENEYIKFERKYNYLGNSIIEFETNLLIKKTGKIKKNIVRLFALQANSLDKLLRGNGFSNVSLFGSFKMDPFKVDSVPLVVAASNNTGV